MIASLIRRDVRRLWGSGALWLPLVFFLMVQILYPFAVGSDQALLRQTGGGMLWVAALLAAILPVDRLFLPDHQAGVIDALVLRGASEEGIVIAKWLAHLLGFAVPLLLAAVPAAVLLGLAQAQLISALIALAIGLPGLAALAIMVAALGAGQRATLIASSLAMLPLAIPILIFGAGSLAGNQRGGLEWLAASSLLLCAIMPFAGGAALRAARS